MSISSIISDLDLTELHTINSYRLYVHIMFYHVYIPTVVLQRFKRYNIWFWIRVCIISSRSTKYSKFTSGLTYRSVAVSWYQMWTLYRLLLGKTLYLLHQLLKTLVISNSWLSSRLLEFYMVGFSVIDLQWQMLF